MKYQIYESDNEILSPIQKAAEILDENNIDYKIGGYSKNILNLSNQPLERREGIRKLLYDNGIVLGSSIRTGQYKPTFKVDKKSNKRIGALVSERIKEATRNISPQKPKGITPTFRYESNDRTTVKLEYMFYDIGCNMRTEDGSVSHGMRQLDEELFNEMQNAFNEECKKLEDEGFVIYFSAGDYKGTSVVRGGWVVEAVNYYVENFLPEN